jgi:SAM-dependent methyltransferase
MSQSRGLAGQLKDHLKRWPRAYGLAHGAFYGLLHVLETHVLGSRIYDWMWGRESELTPAEIAETLAHPHRPFLLDQIAAWAPFESSLEVGCNVGSNLLLLARRFPQVRLHGIDLNARFVGAGKRWLADQGVTNVKLVTGRADDLASFATQSIDITFTDATLLYVGPDRIERALLEMRRVTRRALLFNEWNLEGSDSGGPSLWYYLHWVHDYRRLLEEFFPKDRIQITKLPRELWAQGGGWEEYGALIEVHI